MWIACVLHNCAIVLLAAVFSAHLFFLLIFIELTYFLFVANHLHEPDAQVEKWYVPVWFCSFLKVKRD